MYLVRGLSLVLKKEKWLGWAGQTRYTPLVEVNQAIISLVVLDKYSLWGIPSGPVWNVGPNNNLWRCKVYTSVCVYLAVTKTRGIVVWTWSERIYHLSGGPTYITCIIITAGLIGGEKRRETDTGWGRRKGSPQGRIEIEIYHVWVDSL